ncbi:MAG: hypothetical protein HKN72_10765 [Gemmatimonadetes bacterium]|nr:hypothetical protein [Gemmatimonadota bacterium]
MSLHDDYARLTPFELAFPTDEQAAALVRAVVEEASARGVDPTALGEFLTLGSVEAFVRDTADAAADPTVLHRHGPLVYHAIRFAEEGRRLYLLTSHVARYLAEGRPDGEPKLPAPAGYVQLPQHLVWTRATADAPESVDGVFWSVAPNDLVHFLLVTGLRPDRPGVGVVAIPEGPVRDAGEWLDIEAREEGPDFATDLPGAEIDGLYEIQSAGEVFKLMARCFAYLDGMPDAVERGEPPAVADEGSPGAGPPKPSRLDFSRVTLGAP